MLTPARRALTLAGLCLLAGSAAAAGPPCAPAAGAPPRASAQADDAPSLEELLNTARAEAVGLRAEYAPELPALLDRLARGLADDRDREQEVPLQRLAEMGGTGGELLAESLRAGSQTDAVERARADAALHALLVLRPRTAAPTLQREAQDAIGDTRKRILRALTACGAPAPTALFLRQMFEENTSTLLRSAVVQAIAYIDDPTTLAVLDMALAGDDARLRRDAVRGASAAGLERFLPTARAALDDPALGKELIEPLVDYLLVLQLEDSPLGDFRRIQSHLYGAGAVPSDVGVRVLDACHGLQLEARDIESLLTPLLGRGGELGMAAEILLARSGSRESLKKLEKKADAAVDKAREGNIVPYIERAELYLRLAEYSKSVADYKRVLKASEDSSVFAQNTARLGLARAYAADGKFSKAFSEIEAAGISPRKIVELSGEPYFREMVAHSRYGDVFREARQLEEQ